MPSIQIPKNAKCVDSVCGTFEGKTIQAWLYKADISLGYQSNYEKVPAVFIQIWHGDPGNIYKRVYRYTGKREVIDLNSWKGLKKAIQSSK